MHEAYSRLKFMLEREGLSTADLVRRVSDQGDRVNAKSLYRLADPEEPLEKVDMRVVGAVCQALDIGISDLLTFEEPEIIEQFPPEKQQRMDALMARHAGGREPLSSVEMADLQSLVQEAEEVSLRNARRLANRRRRLLRGKGRRSPAATEEPEPGDARV